MTTMRSWYVLHVAQGWRIHVILVEHRQEEKRAGIHRRRRWILQKYGGGAYWIQLVNDKVEKLVLVHGVIKFRV